MDFPLTRAASAELSWLDRSPSTNAELRERALRAQLPTGTVLATADQPAGRGRLGRSWEFLAGKAIATSTLLRQFGAGVGPAAVFADRSENAPLGVGWASLLAGSALARALRPLLTGHEVRVKWPNDVMVDGKKIAGILCELLPDGSVIIGIGLNLFLSEPELPTERATSFAIAHGDADLFGLNAAEGAGAALADRVLAALVTELRDLESAGQRPEVLRARVSEDSWTLGTGVRVILPGGAEVFGVAVRLAPDGALVVDRADGSGELTVAAGDVEHLR